MYIKYLYMRIIIKTRKTIPNRKITHPFHFQARKTPSVCKETFVLETHSFYIFFIYFHFGADGGGGKTALNLSADHNSSLPSWIWIIFHTIVVHDPGVCHDFDSRSYLQGQGHSTHIPKIRAWAITHNCQVGSGYFTRLLSMTQGCVMTLTQRSKSQYTHTQNRVWP